MAEIKKMPIEDLYYSLLSHKEHTELIQAKVKNKNSNVEDEFK